MDIWLHICRINGNTYRIGDVVTVYELAPGEEVPDFSHLRQRVTGEAKYCTLGVTNLPAKVLELDQVRARLFGQVYVNVLPSGDPEIPDDEEYVAKREVGLDPTFVQFADLFNTPPYRDTVTWGVLRAGTNQKRHGRRITDSDIPAPRGQGNGQ